MESSHRVDRVDRPRTDRPAQVALANTSLTDVGVSQPRLLRGMSSDCAAEWITPLGSERSTPPLGGGGRSRWSPVARAEKHADQ